MERKHTPGPWVADVDELGAIVEASERNDERAVAVCRGPDKAANAHLIAAAPDLLAACKRFNELADAMREGRVSQDYTQLYALVSEIDHTFCRPAIIKAEGR